MFEDYIKTYINFVYYNLTYIQPKYMYIGILCILFIIYCVCKYINYIIKYVSECMVYNILPIYFIYKYDHKVVYHYVLAYIMSLCYYLINCISYLPYINYFIGHMYIILVVIAVCIHKYLYNIHFKKQIKKLAK